MPISAPTAIWLDPLFKEHLTGKDHPECPQRLDAIAEALARWPGFAQLQKLPGRQASELEVQACHTPEYLAILQKPVFSVQPLPTGDAMVSPRSYQVALQAAGSVLAAVDAVVQERARNAFCAVRPPGHHATASKGMGFCLLNNVAIAARYAQRKHKLKNILIVDWDVHHGNGTQDIFYEDDSVLFFSTHQAPLYPFTGSMNETGRGRGQGYTINCPMPAGAGRREIMGAIEYKLLPALSLFCPDLILISAGFDARVGDPLGGFKLTDRDFADLTGMLMEAADTYAHGRLVSVLEGGYSLEGLAAGVTAHLQALAE